MQMTQGNRCEGSPYVFALEGAEAGNGRRGIAPLAEVHGEVSLPGTGGRGLAQCGCG